MLKGIYVDEIINAILTFTMYHVKMFLLSVSIISGYAGLHKDINKPIEDF
jgi:hypothetical protein